MVSTNLMPRKRFRQWETARYCTLERNNGYGAKWGWEVTLELSSAQDLGGASGVVLSETNDQRASLGGELTVVRKLQHFILEEEQQPKLS